MSLLHVIFLGLASSRVAYMVAREDGPAHIFTKWRGWLWNREAGWIAELFDCPYCLSVWAVLLMWFLPTAVLGIIASMWLAFVAIKIMEFGHDN